MKQLQNIKGYKKYIINVEISFQGKLRIFVTYNFVYIFKEKEKNKEELVYRNRK